MLFLFSSLFAHPFSTDEYSLRSSVQVKDKEVERVVRYGADIPETQDKFSKVKGAAIVEVAEPKGSAVESRALYVEEHEEFD